MTSSEKPPGNVALKERKPGSDWMVDKSEGSSSDFAISLATVSHATTDAIFVKDLDGRYLYINPACARLFGCPAEDVVNKFDSDFLSPEEAETIRRLDAGIVASGEATTIVETLVFGGETHEFSTTKAPYAIHGVTRGIIGVARDVTATRRAERAAQRERDRFAAAAESVPGVMCSIRRSADGSQLTVPFVAGRLAEILPTVSADDLRRDASIAIKEIDPADRARFAAALERSASDLREMHLEVRLCHPTHGQIWVEFRSMPTREPDGSTLWYAFIADVTERKERDQALRAERDLLAQIMAISTGVIHTYRREADGRRTIPYLNPRIVEIFGVPLRELIESPVKKGLRHVHPDDMPNLQAAFEEAARSLKRLRTEFRVLHPERGEIWVDANMLPTPDTFDDIADTGILFQGVLTDITASKRAAEKLRASEAALRSVLESAPDIIISIDQERRIRFINRVMPAYRVEDVVGTDAFLYMSPETQPLARAAIDRVFATGKMQVFDVLSPGPDGSYSWYQTRVGPVFDRNDRVVGATLIASDFSEQKRAGDALRVSEERYRKLVEFFPDGILVHRVGSGTISFCNSALISMLKANRGARSVVGRKTLELIADDDHADIERWMEAMLQTWRPTDTAERTLRCDDGSTRRVNVMACPIVDDNEPAFLVVFHDISDMKRTEGLLGSVLESVTDAIVTVDLKGRIESMNPAVSQLFGYSVDELLGKSVSALMLEGDRRAHEAALSRYSPANPRIIGRGREVTALRKDGSTFPIELSVTSFQLDGGRHFTGVMRDISDRKRLEDQFRQAHKMEAFGQLAGGVAHDFNNVLTVILGETELLLGSLKESEHVAGENDDAMEALSDIFDAGQRAASLTRQLLAFSRKTVLEPKILNVNIVVRETEKMLRRLIGEDVALRTKLAPNLMSVNVDPGQLSQVLMNLAVNARDAMPSGGELQIETSNVWRSVDKEGYEINESDGAPSFNEEEEEVVVPSVRTQRPYIRISVRDTGEGMTKEVCARIFQPFFTTKGVGKGTGLGLAVVHGIVSQSGGHIALESAPGKGTSFQIFLPAADVGLEKSDDAHKRGPTAMGTETILLVEDDAAVRRLAMRALAAKGYNVLTARDGSEAVETLTRQGEGSIDLVLTDVVMPVMDGQRLGAIIKKQFGRVKVLYASGYTDDMLIRRGLMSDQVAFVAKPYSPNALLAAVRSLLDTPAKP